MGRRDWGGRIAGRTEHTLHWKGKQRETLGFPSLGLSESIFKVLSTLEYLISTPCRWPPLLLRQPCLEYSFPGRLPQPYLFARFCLKGLPCLCDTCTLWQLRASLWTLCRNCHFLMRFPQGWCRVPPCSLSSRVLSDPDFHDRCFPVIVLFWHNW